MMYHSLIFGVNDMMPQRKLGPHRIASYLREHDWDVEVIDFALYWTLDELKELTKSRISSNTKFIGFGSWFGNWGDNIEDFCIWIKQNYPDIKTVYGGHTYPRFKSKGIDYYVVGYGEKAMLELVRSFVSNSPVSFDPKFFGDRKLISANESYPSFPMNSLRVIYEERDYIESWEWLTTELIRGCKFQCKFCNYPVLGVKEDHSRTTQDFDYQLKDAYEKFGVTNYYTADETLNQDKNSLEKYAKVADNLPFQLRMHGFIRADLLVANKDTWDAIMRLGLFGHHYGIESFNKKSGSAIGKGMDPDRLKEGILEIRDTFNRVRPYRANLNFIVGLPHETIETWNNTVKWLDDNLFGPYGGSDFGEIGNFIGLEIPINPKDAKLSFFSRSWQDFGYREIPNATSKAERPLTYAEEVLDWENDHMNYRLADAMARDDYARLKHKMGVSIWHWGDYGLITTDEKEIYKFQKHHKISPNDEIEDFLKRYINKKLNYKKT